MTHKKMLIIISSFVLLGLVLVSCNTRTNAAEIDVLIPTDDLQNEEEPQEIETNETLELSESITQTPTSTMTSKSEETEMSTPTNPPLKVRHAWMLPGGLYRKI